MRVLRVSSSCEAPDSRELRRFGQTKPYEGGGVTKQPHDGVLSVILYLPPKQHQREPIIITSSSHPHHQFLRLGPFNTEKVQLAQEEEGPGLSGALPWYKVSGEATPVVL